MNHWARFWIVVLSLITGLAALAVLALSFVFPGAALFAGIGSRERLLITMVAAVAIGLLVWGSTTFGPGSDDTP